MHTQSIVDERVDGTRVNNGRNVRSAALQISTAAEQCCYLIARKSPIKISTTSIVESRPVTRDLIRSGEASPGEKRTSGLISLRKITFVYPNVVKTMISEAAEIIS